MSWSSRGRVPPLVPLYQHADAFSSPRTTLPRPLVDAFGGGNVLENARGQLTDASPLEGFHWPPEC